MLDCAYQRHAGERRFRRREESAARHTRTRDHALAPRRLRRRRAKIRRPKPRRALLSPRRQNAPREQTLDPRNPIWGSRFCFFSRRIEF
jgi:hypothetical protein